MSTSGNSDDLMAGFARGPRPRPAHGRVRRATTAASSRRRPMSTSASPCAARASTGSRRAQALRRLQALVGPHDTVDRLRTEGALMTSRPDLLRGARSSTGSTSSAAVGRGCIDEVVTLAHGAGGKSSAALVDAVFVEAFRNANSSSSATAPCSPLPAATAGDLHRLVRGAAAALPRRLHRPPRRARHRQRPRDGGRACRAGSRPRSCSRRASRSPSCGRSSPTWPTPRQAAGVQIVTGDTKVVAQGRRRRPLHHDRGRRRHPRGPALFAAACSPATRCCSRARSATTAWR